MKEKNVTRTAFTVIAVIAAAVLIFAVTRDNDTSNDHSGHDHQHEDSSAKHAGTTDTEPSGKLRDGIRVIEVKARQFEFAPERIVVKKGEQVRLEVTSEDVTHGLEIAEYDINTELKPGKTETISFTADKSGEFHFHCSVFCGKGHSDMHGKLVVVDN